MRPNRLIAALVLTGTSLAFAAPASAPAAARAAAPASYLMLDHSSTALMNAATAKALWTPQLSARLVKLYPIKKWGFVSEVDGGFDDAKVCVITARAMMLPRSGKSLVFPPAHTSIAFGTQAGATAQQCQDLAKAKLSEAIGSVTSALSR